MYNNAFQNNINVITGGFGSGKSEYAINLAINLAVNEDKTTLIDLDLVNAYFRSREAKAILSKHNINTIIPSKDIAFSDLPIAGPGIRDLIKNPNGSVVIDVGGDDLGALALSAYSQELNQACKNMIMIVNPFRPFTNSIRQIINMKEDIEANSGLTIDALVSNPNLGFGTPISLILEKHYMVEAVAKKLDLPILEMVIHHEILEQGKNILIDNIAIPIRPIKIFLSPPWLLNQQKEAQENIVQTKFSGTAM